MTEGLGHPLYLAVKLNNVAVHQIVAGCDEKRAVELFHKALSLVSKGCQAASLDDASSFPSASSSLNGDKRVLPNFGNKDSFLFYSLITFSTPKATNRLSIAECRLLAACVLLNIALVFHRQALAVKKSQKKKGSLLIKAEQSYQKALEVAPDGNNTSYAAQDLDTAVMVKLAAANNFSQSRRERGDNPDKAAKEALMLLFHQLVTKSSSGLAKQEHGCHLDMHELKGMLSNMNRNAVVIDGGHR